MEDIKKFDISSFGKTLSSLEEALIEQKECPHNKFVCDAIIHRFEYTYELCHKMLKRYLEMSEPNAELIDHMSFPDIIRTASEKGLLLNGWDSWKDYRFARNMTSHTYNEKKAEQVCAVIPNFFNDAQHLYTKIMERITAV